MVIVPVSRKNPVAERTAGNMSEEWEKALDQAQIRPCAPRKGACSALPSRARKGESRPPGSFNSMQSIFSDSLGLSFSSNMQIGKESVLVKIADPVLKSPCGESNQVTRGSEYSLACIVCSLLAVLICYTSKRSVSISNCWHDQKNKINTIEYSMGPEPETKKKEEEVKQ